MIEIADNYVSTQMLKKKLTHLGRLLLPFDSRIEHKKLIGSNGVPLATSPMSGLKKIRGLLIQFI